MPYLTLLGGGKTKWLKQLHNWTTRPLWWLLWVKVNLYCFANIQHFVKFHLFYCDHSYHLSVNILLCLQALWQLLWVIPVKFPTLQKSASDLRGQKKLSINFIQNTVSIKTSELLTQVYWNFFEALVHYQMNRMASFNWKCTLLFSLLSPSFGICSSQYISPILLRS